jgi:RNA polymerase sigma factor (sigma-70 family)
MSNGGAAGNRPEECSQQECSATKTTEIDENQLVRNSVGLARYYAHLYQNYAAGTILAHEDLAQEGLIGFLQAIRRHKDGSKNIESFGRDRIKFAIHDAIDFQRRKSRFQICLEISDELDAEYDHQLVDRYAAAQIISGFDSMKKLMRDVMRLIYIDGLSQVETARSIGITEGRVSQLHKSAVEKLRKKYGH